ncbi:Protein ORANGE chloroplastic [Bienertia sinuspersici]
MLCSARIFAVSQPTKPLNFHNSSSPSSFSRFCRRKLAFPSKWRCMSSSMASESDPSFVSDSDATDRANSAFCIIEGPETVQDFDKMEMQEIQDNIRSRRNKIFLLMEEVRRLRIQQRIKSAELGIVQDEQENELPSFPSFIPFLPPLSSANLKQYYATCVSLIAGIMIFGGLLAPSLELKLGVGGTSYADFIQSMHLPMQLSPWNVLPANPWNMLRAVLMDCTDPWANSVPNWVNRHAMSLTRDTRLFYHVAANAICLITVYFANCSQVDPIVASFSGGAVGVISALMVVEINNVKQQEHKRCKYCLGTGYLACARCSSTGSLVLIEPVSTVNSDDQPLSPPKTERCSNCSGSGKVMCPTCLCTGMAMASEHDPRIDPFD